MSEEQWGPGEALKTAKAWEKGHLRGGREYEIFWGDHPHSTSDNKMYARYPDGSYDEFNGHRIQIKVELETYNYLKQSDLSGNEIRKGGECKIFLNGKQWDSFFFRDANRACREADKRIDELCGHTLRLWDPEVEEKEKGRKIFYRELPCVIDYFIPDQGSLVISREDGSSFPPPVYHEKGDYEEKETTIKTSLTDPNIWWFRK